MAKVTKNSAARRGPYSREEGAPMMNGSKGKMSLVEGSKPNPRLPAKSLTPKAKMMKKK